MTFIREKDKQYIQEVFSNLKDDVRLIFFSQELECHYCRETRQILQEVAELSDKIKLSVFNFITDKEIAEKYRIDKIPATVIEGSRDFGVRFYGIPSGYEFSSLIEAIVDVSKADSGLSEQYRNLLKQVSKPLDLQVFVTPTCPYCPAAVRLAHKLAIENENITSAMIEATEFPHLVMKYNVRGVPKTLIGEHFSMEGAMDEIMFIEKLVKTQNKTMV